MVFSSQTVILWRLGILPWTVHNKLFNPIAEYGITLSYTQKSKQTQKAFPTRQYLPCQLVSQDIV